MSSAYLRSDTSEWLKFFESAGIPSKIALQYSILFADHRIQKSHLADLHKSILNEIGITAVGDILAIVKHSKKVADEEAQKMVYDTIKGHSTAAKQLSHSTISPKVVQTKKFAEHREESPLAKRVKRAPDFDVVYTKKLPTGSTERSKLLLKKAAAIQAKKTAPGSSSSVFDRLGVSLSREDPNIRSKVKFATGTKEGSPEVTSTTGEAFPSLESDKVQRKVTSALSRLGPPSTKIVSTSSSASTTSTFDLGLFSGTKVTVVDGKRKLLTATRKNQPPGFTKNHPGDFSKKQQTGSTKIIARIGNVPGGSNTSSVKERLGQRLATSSEKTSAEKSTGVFNRLGKRKAF